MVVPGKLRLWVDFETVSLLCKVYWVHDIGWVLQRNIVTCTHSLLKRTFRKLRNSTVCRLVYGSKQLWVSQMFKIECQLQCSSYDYISSWSWWPKHKQIQPVWFDDCAAARQHAVAVASPCILRLWRDTRLIICVDFLPVPPPLWYLPIVTDGRSTVTTDSRRPITQKAILHREILVGAAWRVMWYQTSSCKLGSAATSWFLD